MIEVMENMTKVNKLVNTQIYDHDKYRQRIEMKVEDLTD